MSAESQPTEDIKIWTVVNGFPTELKVNDVIIHVKKRIPNDVDIIQIAQNYYNVFELPKPLETQNNETSKSNTYDVSNIIKNNRDIVGARWNNYVLYSRLLEIYSVFRDKMFTVDQVVKYYEGVRGFGSTNVKLHLEYLTKRKWVKDYGNRKPTVYFFTVHVEEWDRKFIDMNDEKQTVLENPLFNYDKDYSENKVTESDNDLVAKIGNIDILKSILSFIYNGFEAKDFTLEDLLSKKDRPRGIGRKKIKAHLDYLEKQEIVKSISRFRDGEENVYYKFIVEFREWNLKPLENVNDFTDEFENINELKKIFDVFKNTDFSKKDILTRFHEVDGFSEKSIGTYLQYLLDKNIIYIWNINNCTEYRYRFSSSFDEWDINKNKTVIDFDANELRNRRMLELQSARER